MEIMMMIAPFAYDRRCSKKNLLSFPGGRIGQRSTMGRSPNFVIYKSLTCRSSSSMLTLTWSIENISGTDGSMANLPYQRYTPIYIHLPNFFQFISSAVFPSLDLLCSIDLPTTPGSSILHRSLRRPYPTVRTGQGIHLIAQDGRRILDGTSGVVVSSLGDSNQEVIEASCEQAQSLAFAHTSFFTSNPSENLADFLLDQCNYGQRANTFRKVLWLTSGSESVEPKLKIGRQYHVYNGQPYVGRQFAYHGNTLRALVAGNNDGTRAPFAPILGQTLHLVSRCFYEKDDAPADFSEIQ
ncbi:PLP-dependent transferase [Amniculicola lignicola CBS 123094]|uniref:PLP-dependent transferase n=1 Tax=Amniculicola lignicola CBS 123094 TaxID=1392246 RepID=A0A6A5WED8_9PLEO|nr:PLP-dependent transferase [Amniculicola lignicola CBS 123094]